MDWRCNLTLNEYNVHGDLLSSRSSIEHARPQGLYSRYSTFTSKTHPSSENGLHKSHRKHFQHLRPFSLFTPPASHVFRHDEKPYFHSSNFRMHQFPRQNPINSKPGRWCAIHGKIAWNIHFKKMRRQIEPKFYSFHQNISHRHGNLNHVFSTQFNSFFSTNDNHNCFNLKPFVADKRTGRRHHEYRKNCSHSSSTVFQHDQHVRSFHHTEKARKSSPLHHKEGSFEQNGSKDFSMDFRKLSKNSTNHSDKLTATVQECQREANVNQHFGKHTRPTANFPNHDNPHKSQLNDHTKDFPSLPHVANISMTDNSSSRFDSLSDTNHAGRRRVNNFLRKDGSLLSADEIKKEPPCFFPSEHTTVNNTAENNYNSFPPKVGESGTSSDNTDEEIGKNDPRDIGIHPSDCRDRINQNCQSMNHISAFSVVGNSLLDLERKTQSSSSESSTTSCFESFKSKLDTRYVKNFQTISNLLPEPGGTADGSSSHTSRMSKGISPNKRDGHRKSRKMPLEHPCESRYCHKMDKSSKIDEFLPVGAFEVMGHARIDGESGSSSSENKNTVVCPKGSGGSESSWSSDLSGQSNNRSESEGNSSGSLSSNESPTMEGEEQHTKQALRKAVKHHR